MEGHARLGRAVASVGGLGHVGRAPGTLASFAALLAALPLWHWGAGALLAASCVLALGGLAACRASGAEASDPGWIVIDEVAGQILAMAALPRPAAASPQAAWLGAALLLFRAFDIAKPWPIRAIDRRHDALGIMGDDLAAGAAAALVLLAARLLVAHR